MEKKKNGFVRFVIFAACAAAVCLIGFNCFFVLRENESAIVQRFGRIEAVYVKSGADEVAQSIETYSPAFKDVPVFNGTGLKFKLPFVDQVIRYNNRLLIYDTTPRQVITADKKKLLFDNNAQWRISNPLLFNITMGSIASAETRIDDIIYSDMREKVGKTSSTTIISDKEYGKKMLSDLTAEVNAEFEAYGIHILDVRIKRTDVPEENHQSIYNNMITERNRMAAQYRSEGDEQAIMTRSETDKQVTIILSGARAQSEIIRGEGDAEAARIFNDAYSQSAEFYEFYYTLETYRQTLKNQTTLVLPLSSPFAKFLLGE